jgi:hypothetical protein
MGFVASILARHTIGRSRPLGPERVMRRPVATESASNAHHYLFQLPLALTLHLARPSRIRRVAALFLRRQLAPSSEQLAPPRASVHTQMVERILAREHRVHAISRTREIFGWNSPAHTPTRAAERVPTAPAFRPVEFIPRRPPPRAPQPAAVPPAPAALAQQSPAAPIWIGAAAPPRPPVATAPIPLSPAELGRLTNQVMRAIDKRVVAVRERQGRS